MTINFKQLRVTKMISLKIYIASYGEARNIKFWQEVKFIQRVLLGSSPQKVYVHPILQSSSTSSFKYFTIINFARKANVIVVVDLLVGSCICTWNRLIKAKAISSLTFFFQNSFDTKTYLKSRHPSCSIEKAVSKSFGKCVEVSF